MGDAVSRGEERGRLLRESVALTAPAKINLTLEVLGKRTDGLHEVATVMQTITLADRLRFSPAAERTLRYRGNGPGDDADLILRAARLLRERKDVDAGCQIECTKRIAVAAGLGGGSADAAATLRALNELWHVGLNASDLAELGAELGADVPFLVEGGTALATGTGREIAPLPDAPPHWVVLVPIPATEAAKTADMYRALEPRDLTDGSNARRQAAAISEGDLDVGAVASAFMRVASERWPSTGSALDALQQADAQAVSVAGAGPSAFGLYPKRTDALGGLARVRAEGLPAGLYRFAKRVSLRSAQPAG